VKNFLTSGSIISATSDFIQAVKNQTYPINLILIFNFNLLGVLVPGN
jgi:ketopantoate hydroxymethyltransferase